MANSKNTIQQIPLTGTLNMNVLKTEVKQFEGFNEKNSTVFGGTLSPFYNKAESYTDADGEINYLHYNSKGKCFRLNINKEGYLRLYNGDTLVNFAKDSNHESTTQFFRTEVLDLPEDTVWACQFHRSVWNEVTKQYNYFLYQFYIEKKEIIHNDETSPAQIHLKKHSIDGFGKRTVILQKQFYLNFIPENVGFNTFRSWHFGLFGLAAYNKENQDNTVKPLQMECIRFNFDDDTFKEYFPESEVSVIPQETVITCGRAITSSKMNTAYEIYFVSKSGVVTGETPKVVQVVYNDTEDTFTDSIVDYYRTQSPVSPSIPLSYQKCYLKDANGDSDEGWGLPPHWGERTYEINKHAFRGIYAVGKDGSGKPSFKDAWAEVFNDGGNLFITGHDGNGLIPIPVNNQQWTTIQDVQTYYLQGQILSITDCGLPVTVPGTIENNDFSIIGGDITYFSKGKWYCYSRNLAKVFDNRIELLKGHIFDNRYVILPSLEIQSLAIDNLIYDTEEEAFISGSGLIGYIPTELPSGGSDLNEPFTGCMLGGGYNAGYTINGAKFIGYLSNPVVLTNCPYWISYKFRPYSLGSMYEDYIQLYFSSGNTVQSAKYCGFNPLYNGTIYPLDANSNVLLPVSYNSKIISGYSNNDLNIVNDTAYPLVYNNVNTKLYNYYLLSFMENVEGGFSLQGQSYTYDSENVYAVTYNSGVIQSSQPVCYKKNMEFLGALPTRAIFYSYFNKTFYAFTGDRVLSKLFEASYIDKIFSVTQNPATLSVWICTDKGIYVISDTDVYKHNYISERVTFTDKEAIIISSETVDEVRTTYSNVLSLYKVSEDQELIPVKLKTAYYGLGNEQKAVMDCWYIRLFDENKLEGEVKVKVNTITDVTRHSEEKTFHINPSDYDENNIVYLRYQPKYQECTSMQLELESNIGIYELALGVNSTDSTAQVSKFNF